MYKDILGSRVAVTNITAVAEEVQKWALNKNPEKGHYICVFNVHMCMEAYDSKQFLSVVNAGDLVVPDGLPIVWAQKLLGEASAKQVRGLDLMLALCDNAMNNGISIGLFGGDEKLLSLLDKNLQIQFPKLNIVYKCAPPFRPITEQEDKEFVTQINESGVQILFIGLGCPKQENWMAVHRSRLRCTMVGVGAAFDFVAGTKKNAPRWIQVIGLEWFFRFLHEPRRLWHRYYYNNPRFVWHILKKKFKD